MFQAYEFVVKKVNDQDFQQKLGVLFNVSVELYRVMVSSLLILFVPQKCDDHICSLLENIPTGDLNDKNTIGMMINFITMGAFLLMYAFEIRREEKLIRILEVNNNISTDPESVGKRLEVLAHYKIEQIINANAYYKYCGFFSIAMFSINTVYSGMIIYQYTLGNQTSLNFVTNILFMFSKLSDVLLTANTPKNVFYSAYLTTKVQFNDIDPRELVKIEHGKIIGTHMYPSTAPKPQRKSETLYEALGQELSAQPQSSETSSDDIEKRMAQVIFQEPDLYSDRLFITQYMKEN